jgi:hypothetical protein
MNDDELDAWGKLPTADCWEALDWSRALTEFDEVRYASDGGRAGRISPEQVSAVLWWRPTRREELDYNCSGAIDALLQLADGFAAVTGSWDCEDRGQVSVSVAETLEAAVAGLRGRMWHSPREDIQEAMEAAVAGIRAAARAGEGPPPGASPACLETSGQAAAAPGPPRPGSVPPGLPSAAELIALARAGGPGALNAYAPDIDQAADVRGYADWLGVERSTISRDRSRRVPGGGTRWPAPDYPAGRTGSWRVRSVVEHLAALPARGSAGRGRPASARKPPRYSR